MNISSVLDNYEAVKGSEFVPSADPVADGEWLALYEAGLRSRFRVSLHSVFRETLSLQIVDVLRYEVVSTAAPRKGWAGQLWRDFPHPWARDTAPGFVFSSRIDHWREAVWAAKWAAARLRIDLDLEASSDFAFAQVGAAWPFGKLEAECDLALGALGRDRGLAGRLDLPLDQVPQSFLRGYRAGVLEAAGKACAVAVPLQ